MSKFRKHKITNNSIETNYEWKIVYQPNLLEELLPENNEQTPYPDPKPEKEIEYKFPRPGEYKITLKITNKEEISESITHIVNVSAIEKKKAKTGTEQQRELLTALIKREILCDVFHGTIKGSRITL